MDSVLRESPLSPLANPGATREILDAFGLSTKKQLGQNFLVNDAILKKIVSLAELCPKDFVLEVGPGVGTLTIALLKTAGRVLSVEADSDLPAVLAHTTKPWAEKFALLNKDALTLVDGDFDEVGAVGRPNKFVANLPYAVAATLILDYFQRFPNIESATVMVQKEVADRIAGKPGSKNYGAYTVKLGLYAKVSGRIIVGPQNFFPPPHVDSAVVRLDHTPVVDGDGYVLTPCEIKDACTMADAAFANRRKTLGNSFKTYFSSRGKDLAFSPGKIAHLFEEAAIDSRRRGETLDQAEFIRLARAYRRLCE